MGGVPRYILWQLLGPTVFITVTLTGVIWLTQSLRFLDLIINRGLSAGDFFYLTLLLLPKILVLLLPISLFSATIYIYHRLKTDSEMVIMRAVGLSPASLAAPALVVSVGVAILCYVLTLYLQPLGFRTFKDLQFSFRSNYASVLVQEGVFNTLVSGVTVFIRAREPNGELTGIFVHDARNPSKPTSMMAERGALVQTDKGPRFVLLKGNRQELDANDIRVSFLFFDRYTLDLGQFSETPATRWREPSERYLDELFNPGPGADDVANAGKMFAEAHQRLSSPLYAIVFVLIAVTSMLYGEYNRRHDWVRIFVAAASVMLVQALGLSFTSVASKAPEFVVLVYANLIVPFCLCVYVLTTFRRVRLPRSRNQRTA
ncbi:MAG: LPS export ABC transporter permease LptF [Proteobacteria bacterium]|nr:LPS export ABC transporter permease LptF [Pseudomonadota bacterium]